VKCAPQNVVQWEFSISLMQLLKEQWSLPVINVKDMIILSS